MAEESKTEESKIGRYQLVSTSSNAFVYTYLVDTKTGQTWRWDGDFWVSMPFKPFKKDELPAPVKGAADII